MLTCIDSAPLEAEAAVAGAKHSQPRSAEEVMV